MNFVLSSCSVTLICVAEAQKKFPDSYNSGHDCLSRTWARCLSGDNFCGAQADQNQTIFDPPVRGLAQIWPPGQLLIGQHFCAPGQFASCVHLWAQKRGVAGSGHVPAFGGFGLGVGGVPFKQNTKKIRKDVVCLDLLYLFWRTRHIIQIHSPVFEVTAAQLVPKHLLEQHF